MVLTRSGSYQSYPAVTLQTKTGANGQKFKFVATQGAYAIVSQSDSTSFDVYNGSYTSGTVVIATGGSTYGVNKRFVLEECSPRMESTMTYTAEGKNVKTVTDSRGNTVTNEYDAKNRLLTAVVDAKGNKTSYTYEANTDRLLSVAATTPQGEVKNTYTYDQDRLATIGIGHNGMTYRFAYDGFGNRTSVKIGEQNLAQYAYLPHNGLLSSITYGNGTVLQNVYDEKYRIQEQKINGQTICRYTYDDQGQLLEHREFGESGEENTYRYAYDLIGRITALHTSQGQQFNVAYDDKNRVKTLYHKVGTDKVGTELATKMQYLYGETEQNQKPGLLYGLKVDDVQKVSYTYDALARPTGSKLLLDAGKTFLTQYRYLAGKEVGTTTGLLHEVQNGRKTTRYTYDASGNIASLSENGALKKEYFYDSLSQLIRENDVSQNKTIVYVYDLGGNLTARRTYAYTQGTPQTMLVEDLYTYGNSQWKDQLTAYKGQTITYDAIGNPLNYRGGITMTWKKGRQLATLTKDGVVNQYFYDNSGNRVRKVTGNVETKYFLRGKDILALQTGSEKAEFIYSEKGLPFAMKYQGQQYYYVLNQQGDVEELLDGNGTSVVQYSYNSWGKILSVQGSKKDTVGRINPFRYRGYCYDEETGLYYISSRYYDAEIGRFVNADDVESLDGGNDHIIENNLYIYCFNNPLNMQDEDGAWPSWATKVLIGTAIIAATGILAIATAGTGTALAAIAVGAFKGAAIGATTGAVSGGTIGAISNRISTGSWVGTGKAILNGSASGYMSGAITGAIAGSLSGYAKYKEFGVEKVGKLSSNHSNEGAPGIKYHFNRVKSKNRRVVHSFELHKPHGNGNKHNYWHWQLNRWSKNKSFGLSRWKIWGKKVK